MADEVPIGCFRNDEGYLMLKTSPAANAAAIMGLLSGLSGVEEVYMTSGEWSFVVRVSGNIDEREKKVLAIPGVNGAKQLRICGEWQR